MYRGKLDFCEHPKIFLSAQDTQPFVMFFKVFIVNWSILSKLILHERIVHVVVVNLSFVASVAGRFNVDTLNPICVAGK